MLDIVTQIIFLIQGGHYVEFVLKRVEEVNRLRVDVIPRLVGATLSVDSHRDRGI